MKNRFSILAIVSLSVVLALSICGCSNTQADSQEHQTTSLGTGSNVNEDLKIETTEEFFDGVVVNKPYHCESVRYYNTTDESGKNHDLDGSYYTRSVATVSIVKSLEATMINNSLLMNTVYQTDENEFYNDFEDLFYDYLNQKNDSFDIRLNKDHTGTLFVETDESITKSYDELLSKYSVEISERIDIDKWLIHNCLTGNMNLDFTWENKGDYLIFYMNDDYKFAIPISEDGKRLGVSSTLVEQTYGSKSNNDYGEVIHYVDGTSVSVAKGVSVSINGETIKNDPESLEKANDELAKKLVERFNNTNEDQDFEGISLMKDYVYEI